MRLITFLALLVSPALAADVDQLEWFSGCFTYSSPNATIEESWSKPAGGILLGYSRTIRGGKVVEYEFVRIAPGPDSRLTYFAHPSGQAPAAFALRSSTPTEVVFENLEHDFPQRIIYRKSSEGLFARIEGTRNGQSRGRDIPMTRRSCP